MQLIAEASRIIEIHKLICYKIITGHTNRFIKIQNNARCGEYSEMMKRRSKSWQK